MDRKVKIGLLLGTAVVTLIVAGFGLVRGDLQTTPVMLGLLTFLGVMVNDLRSKDDKP